MTLFVLLVVTIILELISVLLLYQYLRNYVTTAMDKRFNQHQTSLLRFTWHAIQIVGLIWLIIMSLLIVVLRETGPFPEWGNWNIRDYSILLPDWLRMWTIVIFPGIPAIMSISNYVAFRLRSKKIALHDNDATYTGNNDVFGVAIAALLVTGLILIVSPWVVSIL
jgi:hypothetical protein